MEAAARLSNQSDITNLVKRNHRTETLQGHLENPTTRHETLSERTRPRSRHCSIPGTVVSSSTNFGVFAQRYLCAQRYPSVHKKAPRPPPPSPFSVQHPLCTLNDALRPKSTSFTSASSASDSKQIFSSLMSRCCRIAGKNRRVNKGGETEREHQERKKKRDKTRG